MEDDLIYLVDGKRPQFFQMEDDQKKLNGRRPKYSCEWNTTLNSLKWEMTSIFLNSEDDLKRNNAT